MVVSAGVGADAAFPAAYRSGAARRAPAFRLSSGNGVRRGHHCGTCNGYWCTPSCSASGVRRAPTGLLVLDSCGSPAIVRSRQGISTAVFPNTPGRRRTLFDSSPSACGLRPAGVARAAPPLGGIRRRRSSRRSCGRMGVTVGVAVLGGLGLDTLLAESVRPGDTASGRGARTVGGQTPADGGAAAAASLASAGLALDAGRVAQADRPQLLAQVAAAAADGTAKSAAALAALQDPAHTLPRIESATRAQTAKPAAVPLRDGPLAVLQDQTQVAAGLAARGDQAQAVRPYERVRSRPMRSWPPSGPRVRSEAWETEAPGLQAGDPRLPGIRAGAAAGARSQRARPQSPVDRP